MSKLPAATLRERVLGLVEDTFAGRHPVDRPLTGNSAELLGQVVRIVCLQEELLEAQQRLHSMLQQPPVASSSEKPMGELTRTGPFWDASSPSSTRSVQSPGGSDASERTLASRILHWLLAREGRSFQPAEVATGIGAKEASVRTTLSRLGKRSAVTRTLGGRFAASKAQVHLYESQTRDRAKTAFGGALSQPPVAERIASWLAAGKGESFTIAEIAEGISAHGPSVQAILSRLVVSGVVIRERTGRYRAPRTPAAANDGEMVDGGAPKSL